MASNIGNSCVAIAINSQTNVINYLFNDVNRYVGLCWTDYKKDFLKNNLSFNAIRNYKIKKPKLLYVQNIADIFNYDNHFLLIIE